MPGLNVSLSAVKSQRPSPDPFTLVIFGASGDLTSRKLIPAVFNLCRRDLLDESFRVVGYGRTEMSDEQFRQQLRDALTEHAGASGEEACLQFLDRVYYVAGQYDQPKDVQRLKDRLDELSDADEAGNCLFYLSTPPEQFANVAHCLGEVSLARRGPDDDQPWSRLVVEKPFGHDLESARTLNRELLSVFEESQVFRIDHYLGKETVQNLLVLRLANGIFEPLWNSRFIDHVQITVAETVGVGGRGGYYEKVGALRDMAQNHLLNVLCLVAMEPPVSLGADAIRDEKVKLLRSLRRSTPTCVGWGIVRAQYEAGDIDGEQVCGYLEEKGVPDDSITETFAAFRVNIDNWRWAGVPFYLRTGKRLARKVSEIGVFFKPTPQVLFNDTPYGPMLPNALVVRIQPNEGVSMRIQVKRFGPGTRIEPFWMEFGYRGAEGEQPPDAYERLLLDAAVGDSTLYIRSDEIEAAWEFMEPILAGCRRSDVTELPKYPAGTWGPVQADEMIAKLGHRWFVRPDSEK